MIDLRAQEAEFRARARSNGKPDDIDRLALMNAAQVEPVAIRWSWHKWIPDEAVTLLAGREGTGKSTFSARLAADVSHGRLAGHLYGQPADVIMATLEDPAASVAVPRLIAADADLERVHFLQLGGDQTEPLAIRTTSPRSRRRWPVWTPGC